MADIDITNLEAAARVFMVNIDFYFMHIVFVRVSQKF